MIFNTMTESSDISELSYSSDEDIQQNDNMELSGMILKNYNIICELGRGASSIVWLAYNISNNNFYALKVQNHSEYKEGIQEIKFVQKLPENPKVFNNMIEYFVINKTVNGKNVNYLCSSWELHCSNIDSVIRKGMYPNGFPLPIVKKIMKQLISGVYILHKNFKVFHGDIKTDNILIKGLNAKDEFIIKRYTEENFFDKYSESKKKFWLDKNKDITKINMMKKEDKLKIRTYVHQNITNKILDEFMLLPNNEELKYSINSKYLDSMDISLADFGTHCEEHNFYEESFGTRYYMAPEIILGGKCSYPVDIWALGCTFYELLTGDLLFDPIKDSTHSRDYYHLCLINETCGEYSPSFLKKTKHYKKFFNSNYELKGYHKKTMDRLDRKLSTLNVSNIDLEHIKICFKLMFEIDPAQRVKIDKVFDNMF